MKPMLLNEYPYHTSLVAEQNHVYIQPKLNGWRAVIDTTTGRIYSRSGREIVLPHISADILSMTDLPGWLDGELYIEGGTDRTVHSGIAIHSRDIKFYCFDAIMGGNYSARLDVVHRIHETENVRIVATSKIVPAQINEYYNKYLSSGMEGAVIRLDREYVHGRTENVLKLKPSYSL